MEPEVNLQRLKGFIFGRKDVWQPIIYMIYMTKIIFFTTLFGLFFLPVRSKIFRIFKAFAQAFTWLQKTFWRFWLYCPFLCLKWSSLFSRKNRMTFKTQGSGSFFFLHILFLPLSLAPPCAEISENLNTIKRFFRRWRFDFGGFRFLSIGHVGYSVGFGWNDAKWKICRFFNVIGWLNGEWIHGRVSTPYTFLMTLFPSAFS